MFPRLRPAHGASRTNSVRYANKEDKGAAFANFKPQKYDRACMKARLICVQTEIIPLWRCDLGKKGKLATDRSRDLCDRAGVCRRRTPQEAVAEEIITTAKKGDFFDHSGNKVI